ncbi:MAG: hypothetical protein OEZ03_14745 [Alphaproteobacteria bacterium]|nr:hypothetical protein [Alphaproteobacteria bacterium]
MYDILLMIHFLSLGAGLGISLTMFVLGLQAGRIPPAEFGPMMGRVGLAMKNVSIAGVSLLVLSGVGLVLVERGMVAAGGSWFHAKMVFVVGVVIAFTVVQVNQARARRGENPPVAGRRAMLAGRVALASAVAATIMAVLAFG